MFSVTCASRQAPAPRPPAAPEHRALSASEQLRADLGVVFALPSVSNAHLGALVRSLHTGDTLFAMNERRMLVPASNQKLLTAAVAARTLGWDYRYTTRLLATGKIDANGTLDGDLIVVGGGDPTINPRHPLRWAVLDDWAARVAARGVRIIGGHLIGDDSAFAEPGWGSGWSWEDLVTGYGAPIGALQYHEDEVELMIGPGIATGTPAIIAMSPYGSGLLLDNQAITVAANQATRITTDRVPGTIFLTVRGQVALGSTPRATEAAVENPTRLFMNAFREALSRKGIVVAGSALDIDEAPSAPDTSKAEVWVEDRSAPLYEIVDVLLKWSRNEYAETLLWSLSPPGAPASEAAGLAVLRAALPSLGVEAGSFSAFDGSGLSRYDMVSADALVRLLTTIWHDPPLLGPFRSALPVAGVSGSLEHRMKGTAAEGRVWAKTGSMFNIRTVSGYVLTADSEMLAFSFLANNYTVPSAEIDAIMDTAMTRLAGFRR
ncbi:MAG TPA: D-alanyl-D-alanine carboxypeptidase/D-alanyl-D-alanine-endopeptidase [Vicinamibacterales bacterium]|nr:D-alanyl-D-alanine carboxypeptidase/D-alanyl-D-alanine-endopeptidase [Vicinamibacterales bacterium]